MIFKAVTALVLAALVSAGEARAQVRLAGTRLGAPPQRSVKVTRATTKGSAPAPGFTLSLASREESRVFYNAVFSSTEGREIGWTGNATTGVAGTTAADFREAVRLRINCFRAMAGVPSAVQFSGVFHPKCQQAALMMRANSALSHTPPSSWIFYTAEGADAADNSNLSLGDFGTDAVSGYMEDPGATNDAVGHRRWFLYPQTQEMGTGDIPGDYTLGNLNSGANAVWVIDSHIGDPRPAVRDDFVAWPPPGYVPHPLVVPRWSFSYPNTNFSTTTVSMTKNGSNLPVTKEIVEDGYGEDTLVWVPQGQDPNDWEAGVAPAQDDVFVVTLTGVIVGAQTRSFSYTVRSFDPARAGSDTVEPTIAGPQIAAVGIAAQFTCASVPRATGYDWETAVLGAAPASNGAENGASGIIPHVSGYSVVADTAASGAHSFHLATAQPQPQWFELSATFLPRTGATLRFKSRLGYATAAQTARVQISKDGGVTWLDAFTQGGSGAAGEAVFATRTIDLSSYVGRSIRVRFRYDYRDGALGYFDSADEVGWLVDDIVFTATDTLGNPTTTRTGAAFAKAFASAGSQVVRVRPVFYSAFPGEWAPFHLLAVSAPSVSLVVNVAPPGSGTVSPGYEGTTSRVLGEAIHIQATPATGYLFSGWTGDASTSPILDFTMSASRTLTANFVLNQLPAGAGKYFGIIASVPATHASAGIFSVSVSSLGRFTGKLLIGGKTTRFSGKLSATGAATFAAPPLAFSVALDGSGVISATLNGESFTANRRSVSSVPSAWLGAYTARFSASAPGPQGDGWSRFKVSATGTVKLAASLADGTKISTSGSLTTDGRWLIYIPLHSGKGSLSGIASLADNPASDITAPLRWFRPASTSTRWALGWQLDCAFSGAHYTPPVAPAHIFSDLAASSGAATVRAEFVPSLEWPVTIAAGTNIVAAGDPTLRTSLSARTGAFSVRFYSPATERNYRAKGVVIQKEQVATGFALTPSESIRVRLEAP